MAQFFCNISLGGWSCGLAELVQEISRQVVLSCLELLFCAALGVEDGDVQSVFLGLEEVRIEEVHDLGTILPSPCTQDSGAIDSISSHVIVEQGIEVQVGHAAHRPLQALHLQLCLIVHLANQLLTVLELHAKFFLLTAIEIRALLIIEKQQCLVSTKTS